MNREGLKVDSLVQLLIAVIGTVLVCTFGWLVLGVLAYYFRGEGGERDE